MHTEEQIEMHTRRPPAKMDIFNPYTQIGGKSKSCQAETVVQKAMASLKQHGKITCEHLSRHIVGNSCSTQEHPDMKRHKCINWNNNYLTYEWFKGQNRTRFFSLIHET